MDESLWRTTPYGMAWFSVVAVLLKN